MHLFIDANRLLSFYGLPTSELTELEKLIALVKDGTITLHITDQVVAEVRRNRAKVLFQLRKAMSDARLQANLPVSSDQFAQRPVLEAALKEAQKRHSELVQALDVAVRDRTLAADGLLDELFAIKSHLDTSVVLERARARHDRGQPPGKGAHIGDELNWEALADAVPPASDLHIVSDDGDYFSDYNREEVHESLADEWDRSKGAQVFAYRDLAKFTGKHFPAITLASDVQKVRHIQALASSASFADTHVAVSRLSQYALFSPAQAKLIIEAAATNSQVRWIARDGDVQELLARVIDAHRTVLEPGYVALLEAEMYPPQQQVIAEDDDEALPL